MQDSHDNGVRSAKDLNSDANNDPHSKVLSDDHNGAHTDAHNSEPHGFSNDERESDSNSSPSRRTTRKRRRSASQRHDSGRSRRNISKPVYYEELDESVIADITDSGGEGSEVTQSRSNRRRPNIFDAMSPGSGAGAGAGAGTHVKSVLKLGHPSLHGVLPDSKNGDVKNSEMSDDDGDDDGDADEEQGSTKDYQFTVRLNSRTLTSRSLLNHKLNLCSPFLCKNQDYKPQSIDLSIFQMLFPRVVW